MPSTASSRLRVELQANGENDNTWGTNLNSALQRLEEGIADYVAVTMSDANYTLTSNDYTADEARGAVLKITGTLTTGRNVVVPTAEKWWFIWNATTGGFAITVKTSGGSGIAVPNGAKRILFSDGTNVLDAINDLPTGTTVNGTAFGTMSTQNANAVSISGGSVTGITDITLADGGTGASLADPGADRIMFWDDSAGFVDWLTPGTGLSITTTTINVTTTLDGLTGLTTTAAGRSVLDFADPNADKIIFWDDSATDFVGITLPSAMSINDTDLRLEETWAIALSDETTAITTGTNKATMIFPYNVTVVNVYASLNTVSSSGTPTIDINESGTTILSTKITIDVSEKTSLTAATAPVISDSSITAGNEVGFDIDTAGTGAKGLKVYMVVRRTS